MPVRHVMSLLLVALLAAGCTTPPATNDNLANDNGGMTNDNTSGNDNGNPCPVGADPACDIGGFFLVGDTATECTLITLNCRSCCGFAGDCVEACYRPNGDQSEIYCDCDGSGECSARPEFLSCPTR